MLTALLSLGFSAFAQAPDLLQPLRTGERAPADAAVVIGIERYPFVSDVPHAARDAQAMYNLLVYTRGVPADRVRLLDRGANREQILEAVRAAGAQVGRDGAVWVYFAGHGAADASTGERLLLGDDARQDAAAFTARGVTVTELRQAAGTGGGAVHLLLDTCYAGVGRAGDELLAGKRFLVPAYAMAGDPRSLEWSAAGPDQLSGPLPTVQHGAFTYFAVGALRGWADGQLDGVRDGKVTAEEARLYVNQALRTVQITDQTSQLTAADPSRTVLSASAKLEAGPPPEVLATLRGEAPAAPVGPSAPAGSLDVRDRAAVTAWVQGVLDGCVATHGASDPTLARTWGLRFRVHAKKGFGNLLIWAPESTETWSTAMQAVHTCLRGELRDRTWTSVPKTATYNNMFTVSASPAPAPVPGPAPAPAPAAPGILPHLLGPPQPGPPAPSAQPPTAEGVQVTLVNRLDAWADVRVNGRLVASFRGEDELPITLPRGAHTVEVLAFMADTPMVTGRLDTLRARQITCGLVPDAGFTCYEHPGWTPRP